MHAAYYRGAMGILLVYDITDEASFNNVRNWMRNIEQHASDNVNKVRRKGVERGRPSAPAFHAGPLHHGAAWGPTCKCTGCPTGRPWNAFWTSACTPAITRVSHVTRMGGQCVYASRRSGPHSPVCVCLQHTLPSDEIEPQA